MDGILKILNSFLKLLYSLAWRFFNLSRVIQLPAISLATMLDRHL